MQIILVRPGKSSQAQKHQVAGAGYHLSGPDQKRGQGQEEPDRQEPPWGGLPETQDLKLLEPLRELFEGEVRKLGVALGL